MSLLLQFIVAFTLIGIAYMLFYSPYLLSKGLILIVDGYIDGSGKVKSALPFINQFMIARYYEDFSGSRAGYIQAITGVIFAVTSAARITLMFIAPGMLLAAYATMLLSIAAFIPAWLSAAVMNRNILAEDTQVYGVKRFAYIAFPPLGNYYIGTYLSRFLEQAKARKEAFQ